MMNFNKKLKELRKESGLTQKDVAARIGVVESCYANWEQGRTEPSISAIKQLCSIFEVSADEMLGIE